MDERDLGSAMVDQALRSAKGGDSFEAILVRTLTAVEQARPSEVWSAIGDIDYLADVRALVDWIPAKLAEDPPDDLSALWFGLYEVAGPDLSRESTEAVLAVSGGPGYPNPDWLDDQTWYPGGYAPTPGLRSILPIAASGGSEIFSLASYVVVFSYVLGLVVTALGQVDRTRVLRRWARLGIAAGFHDGDIVDVGILTRTGFDRSNMRWL